MTALLLLLLGAIIPLAITPGLLFHFDISPKTIVLALSAAVALLRFRALPRELSALWSRRSGRALVCVAGLQMLWICVATAVSVRPSLSVFGSTWRQFGLMTTVPMIVVTVLVAAHFCFRPQSIALFLRIVVIAGVVGAAYGIAQYFDLDPFQNAPNYQAHDGDSVIVRPPGTLGHADYFAWWLAIEFFCGLAVAKSTSSMWRIAGSVCMGCTAFAVLLSGTRAALFAIAAGAIAIVFLTKFKPGRRHIMVSALVLLAGAGFLASPAGTRLRARVAWSGEEPAGGARPLLWRDSFRMGVSKPLAGFGPETFQSTFGAWESTELARLYPDFHHESPHNLALDALTSEGLPGLLLLLAWVFVAFQTAHTVRSQPVIGLPLVVALIASATASMFNAAVLGPLLLTMLVLSILVALELPGVQKSSAIQPRLLIPVCGTAAAFAAFFAIAVAVSDFNLAAFQRAPGAAASKTVLETQLPATAEDIYISRVLLNQCEHLKEITVRLGCWRDAEQVAAHAVGTAGDPANAWYNLAVFTAAQNDARGTEMALTKAIASAPNWFKPHWMMGQLLAQTGDLKRAAAETQHAAELDANQDPDVQIALRQIQSRLH